MNVRIAPLTPPYSDRVTEDLEKLMPPGMPPLGLFRTLAHNPRVLRRVRRGGLLDPGSITIRQREIVILRTTARAGAEYEWGVHAAFFGPTADLDESHLHATVHGDHTAECWTPEDALVVRLTDELFDTSGLTDETWSALREVFDEGQIIELLMLAGQYRAISYIVNGTGVAPEDGAPTFPSE